MTSTIRNTDNLVHPPEPGSLTIGRRPLGAAKLVAGTLALTMGALGAGLAASALPAYADVVSGNYSIVPPSGPSGPVNAVIATPATVGAGSPASFDVSFTVPSALLGARASSISITPSETFASAPASVDLIAPGCVQAGTSGAGGAGMAAPGALSVELSTACNIDAGSRVEVDFDADAPSPTGHFYFTVTTSMDVTPAASNAVAVTSSAALALSAASHAFGANTTYTIANVPVVNLNSVLGNQNTIVLSAGVTSGTEALTFYAGGTSGYTVTYTPPGGAPVADPVQSDDAQGSRVTLTVATPVTPGGTLNITALGTNPAAAATPQSDDITVAPGSGTPQTTNAITFGSSVSNATLSLSSVLAGSPATYNVGFKASSPVSVGGDIFLSETCGPTNFGTVSGVEVIDTNQGWHYVAAAPTLASGSAVVPVSDPVNAGDSLIVSLVNVTNPQAGTVSDFAVSTSSDAVAADVAPYVIGSLASSRASLKASPSSGVVVTPAPASAGELATYTISNIHASAALAGGVSTIRLVGPAGTVFPGSPYYYSVVDGTRSSGSGTVTAAVVGGGTNDIAITVPNSISPGDALQLTAQGVVNPGVPSSAYSIDLEGNVTGPTTLPPFPSASASYPNGSIINFAGNDYVFAGGRAFAIATSSDLAKLQKVDHAAAISAPAGANAPSNRAPRPGTLLFTRPVNGSATIYVAGTDGELHGFATPKQFAAEGYDPALVVTVTSLGGLAVGRPAGAEGAAGNALGTSADGSIVDSSGAYFVFAGGRAFSIANPTELKAIRHADKANEIRGTVTTAQKSAGIASGVVLSALGPVYASYHGELFGFRSMAQLESDGYSGTAAVTVPSTGGLDVQAYSGS
jgi:hypothetical protein